MASFDDIFSSELKALQEVFAWLFPAKEDVITLLATAGINSERMNLDPPPNSRIFYMFNETLKQGKMEELLTAAHTAYPTTVELDEAIADWERLRQQSADPDPDPDPETSNAGTISSELRIALYEMIVDHPLLESLAADLSDIERIIEDYQNWRGI